MQELETPLQHSSIPSQRETVNFVPRTFRGDFSSNDDIAYVADILRDKEVIVVDNASVYAIVGDAYGDPYDNTFGETVARIKQSDKPEKVFGTMLPTDQLLQYVDTSVMTDETIRALKESQETLSGLAFIKVPITDEAASCLPDSVVSYDEQSGVHWLQNYDPQHKTTMQRLLDASAPESLTLPIITSLNKSGQKEIIDKTSAEVHIDGMGLPILHDKEALRLARGSYTIFEFSAEGITLRREGNIDTAIFRAILEKNVIVIPVDVRRSVYPDLQFAADKLDKSLRSKVGADLAHSLRRQLGWQE